MPITTPIKTGPGSGLNADLLDGQHAAAFAPVSGGGYVAADAGYSMVGSIAFVAHAVPSTFGAGATMAGTSLFLSYIHDGASIPITSGIQLSGTWRMLFPKPSGNPHYGLAQRIA